ncbi:MAG: lysophospholipid acyltransferase family protein [Spirochaetaceae bacterium]
MRNTITVPERRYRRRIACYIGKFLLWALTRQTVHGAENFPRKDPFIVAGNHRGIMEVFLMVSVCPRNLEILGAGDIPLDKRYRYIADYYGYIPYRRGQMDRKALMTAEKVLEKGRVVGIFPEGGIWKAARKSAHRGVAWLSFSSGAPVVPVGFGGVHEAIHRALRLRHPRLETWIGRPIPVPERDPSKPRKQQMEEHAEYILDHIDALIPDWDKGGRAEPEWEDFELELWVSDPGGREVNRAAEITDPETLSRFFHIPVMLDAVYYNLKRRAVKPLRRFGRPHSAGDIYRAACVVLGYVRRTNPAFFTYRLGDETAEALERALVSLRGVAAEAAGYGGRIRIVPVYRYRMPGWSEAVEVRKPRSARRF